MQPIKKSCPLWKRPALGWRRRQKLRAARHAVHYESVAILDSRNEALPIASDMALTRHVSRLEPTHDPDKPGAFQALEGIADALPTKPGVAHDRVV